MKLLCLAVILAVVCLTEVNSHGALWEPPMRGSAYKFGFNTPPDWNDLGHNCGSFKFDEHGCSACGDPESECPNGSYCKNVIVRTYKSGATIPVMVHMGANHGGVFQFRLCPTSNGAATWDCLEKNRLKVVEAANQKSSNGGTIWQEPHPQNNNGMENITLHVELPKIKCDRCVFQWHWSGALWSGTCTNGTVGFGCGPQQTYINCADIKIE